MPWSAGDVPDALDDRFGWRASSWAIMLFAFAGVTSAPHSPVKFNPYVLSLRKIAAV
jgi:hypothetical protein